MQNLKAMRIKHRNSLYILPNSFTIAALFFGFYAITRVLEGDIGAACIAIIISAILDSCDGFIARLTRTESKFGVELDSLSDVVCFGAAPAIMLFQFNLQELGKIGFAASFIFCAAVAMRLARFNSISSNLDKRYFIGLPCPAAALFIISYIASFNQHDISPPPVITTILSVWVAITMVSGLRYPSLKTIKFKKRLPFRFGLLIIFLLAVIYATAEYYMHALFLILFIYIAYGYLAYIPTFLQNNTSSSSSKPND